ncbi:MAG: sarcosine oxidase subunit gamma [Pseudomonadota bacterium]
MHDLIPSTALGGSTPRTDTFPHVTLSENDGLALASVAARLGREADCHGHLSALLGRVPGPGQAVLRDPEAGFWMGPEQWMIGAPSASQELLAEDLKARFGDSASITEQSGGWVCFDLIGPGMVDVMERLCAAPVRRMQAGDAQRTVIHQLGCFVIRREDPNHLRILGPRASAGTLHHALVTAARATA